MNDYLIGMGFNVLFTFLANLKGSNNRARYRAAFLKLYKAIGAAYSGDADFSA